MARLRAARSGHHPKPIAARAAQAFASAARRHSVREGIARRTGCVPDFPQNMRRSKRPPCSVLYDTHPTHRHTSPAAGGGILPSSGNITFNGIGPRCEPNCTEHPPSFRQERRTGPSTLSARLGVVPSRADRQCLSSKIARTASVRAATTKPKMKTKIGKTCGQRQPYAASASRMPIPAIQGQAEDRRVQAKPAASPAISIPAIAARRQPTVMSSSSGPTHDIATPRRHVPRPPPPRPPNRQSYAQP